VTIQSSERKDESRLPGGATGEDALTDGLQSQAGQDAPRICFVNRFFYPDVAATSQLLADLAFDVAEHRHNVKVITSRQRYEDSAARLPPREFVGGLEIIRVWTPRFGRARLLGRALDYVGFYAAAGAALFKNTRRRDVIVAMTDPPLISVVAAFIAQVRGARLINWVQDVFPEVAAALGVRGSALLVPMLRVLRNRAARNAETNVALGRTMARRLTEQGTPAQSVVIVHNWADGKSIRPIPHQQNALRAAWRLQEKFVVGYSGNMGRAHEFETLLQIASLLRSDAQFLFLFIGDGAKRTWIERETKLRGLNNVTFKPYQARDMLAQSLSVADIHVISLHPSLEGLIVPSKFYGVAAAGRPVLYVGDANGEIGSIIRSADCGSCVGVGEAGPAAEFLRALIGDPARVEQLGRNARRIFDERYDKRFALASWHRVIGVDEDIADRQAAAQHLRGSI
jgi:glycosyltransferase involved in cell wall biosynthesis